MMYITLRIILSISTHTLTWSVTNGVTFTKIDNVISTHTLTWSVTLAMLNGVELEVFQLTRSRGA